MTVVATNVESDVFQSLYKEVYQVFDADTVAFALATVSAGRQILTDALAPLSKRNCIMKTSHTTKFLTDTKGLFQDSGQIAEQYREGIMGRTVRSTLACSSRIASP